MAKVSTILTFSNQAEAAFSLYKAVFGNEFINVMRWSDGPNLPGAEKMTALDKNLIMHIELPIFGGHVLMGGDAPESCGVKVSHGNGVHIVLEPDSRAETERIFKALSDGGKVEMPLQDMFWGAFHGSCADRFGIHWMLNCYAK